MRSHYLPNHGIARSPGIVELNIAMNFFYFFPQKHQGTQRLLPTRV